MPNIVVLGAGVSGLTCALLLSRNREYQVTVVAKHMPGDYDIEYTSPFAGGNFVPMADEENSKWERETWPVLRRLAIEVPEAGIHLQQSRLYRRAQDVVGPLDGSTFAEKPWFASMFPDWRDLTSQELPEGMRSGSEFGSVCINTPLYLGWLVGQCRLNGVVFRRANLRHIDEAAGLCSSRGKAGVTATVADVVVNCSGLLACRLGGVMDTAVTPARGQTVLVRNELSPMNAVSGVDDGEDGGPGEICYSMMRAAGGGTILGGTYQFGRWDADPDPSTALRIMRRVVDLAPELAGGKGVAGLDVVRHAVGLRPYRTGGARVEKGQSLASGAAVVHNYGHAGWGYQASYGCANQVVGLVEESVRENKRISKL